MVSSSFEQLYGLAQTYCQHIEAIDEQKDHRRWLLDLLRLLPQLHAAIAAFLEDHPERGNYMEANLDIRFALFSKLHHLLGEKDAYWMEYDLGMDECKSGSLADDLTDIYCELKRGLKILENDPEQKEKVLSNWKTGFHFHWGRHLIDAERHLYELSVKGSL